MHRKITITLLFALSFTCAHADFTRKMLVRWTFNNPDRNKVMLDDSGKFKLTDTRKDGRAKITCSNGTVAINEFVMLAASGINSSAMPKLAKDVTIWARFKVSGKPGQDCFFLGLLNAGNSADWKQQSLSMMFGKGAKMRLFGWLSNKKEFAATAPDSYKLNKSWIEVALVFSSAQKSATVFVNGKVATRKLSAADLAPFKCLAFGRLKLHSAVSLELDELRIYDSAMSSEWLSEIEPVE